MHCAPATAYNIATSKMAAVLPTGAKITKKGRFCRTIKLLFAVIMPQIGLQLPGLLSKNKKMKKLCVIPKSAVVFHFAAVELWNY